MPQASAIQLILTFLSIDDPVLSVYEFDETFKQIISVLRNTKYQ